ncbi:cytochrome P450 family protein [Streptomyces yaizuensis]|uniref:Cytochrome P450 n=1 Tax=Streptomyces yaizuensis TaxID=2989713 RepID=A0ABQ5P315_9ACTN|nr:cytochrome P450 [Streptomyces sp. YSPA8]GLF96875.1 cytochrome P450 [Streptomyces sp. YSPA8]
MTGAKTSHTPVLDSGGGDRLYAQLHELRSAGPAVQVRLPEGVVAWSVTRGDVVRRLAADPRLSRDARGVWPGYRPGKVAWLSVWVDMRSMATSEGAEHTRLRKMLGPLFSPRRLDGLRIRVEAIVAALLDRLAAGAPGEPVDIRAHFTDAIPARLMCDLFGVPDDLRPALLEAMGVALVTGIDAETSRRHGSETHTALEDLVEARRATPGDDLTSLLLSEHEGDRLTEKQVISTLNLMIGAGTQTTVALLTHAIHELLRHPAQLAAVRADPAGWPEVVEETLRLHPPVVHLPLRFAREDVDLGDGCVIAAGDAVILGFGAAGLDPAVHEHAEDFHMDRADKAHLAFGHGIHFCLGAPLARMEALVALPALFDRFPRLALAEPDRVPVPHTSFIANDFDRLRVLLDGPPAA